MSSWWGALPGQQMWLLAPEKCRSSSPRMRFLFCRVRGPSASNGQGLVWGQTWAVESYKECKTHPGALLLPPGVGPGQDRTGPPKAVGMSGIIPSWHQLSTG